MKKLLLTAALFVLSTPATGEEYTVKMVTHADDHPYHFIPMDLTIQPGDTVKFVNDQEDYHNVVFDRVPKGAEIAESPMMGEKGESWSHTFNTAGTYGFHCHPHAGLGMMGTLIVGQASAPEDMMGMSGHGEHAHGAHESEEHNDDHAEPDREILYWVAPMDPDFRRDEPGKSPMGMDLVPVYEDKHRENNDNADNGRHNH